MRTAFEPDREVIFMHQSITFSRFNLAETFTPYDTMICSRPMSLTFSIISLAKFSLINKTGLVGNLLFLQPTLVKSLVVTRSHTILPDSLLLIVFPLLPELSSRDDTPRVMFTCKVTSPLSTL